MNDSVEAGLCDELALEYVIPVFDRQLAGQYESLPVVAVIDYLFESMLYLSFEPDHTEVVYDDQVVCRELVEEVGLTPFEVHEPELLDERVHGEVERLDALTARPFPKGAGEEGLARARWSFHDEGTAVPNVAACCEFCHIGRGESSRGVCFQFFQSCLEPEACVPYKPGDAVRLGLSRVVPGQQRAVAPVLQPRLPPCPLVIPQKKKNNIHSEGMKRWCK